MAEKDNMQSNCEQLRDLLPAYIIGATDEAETRLVEALMPLCPEVEAEMLDYVGLSQAMLFQTSAIKPPERIHDTILAAIAPEAVAPEPPANTLRPANWRTWLAVAAAALLLLTNGFWLWQALQPQDNNPQLTQLQQENALLARLILDDGPRVQLISNEAVIEEVMATLLWSEDAALLLTDALPTLPPDRTYQLWLIREGEVQSAGLFQVDAEGQTRYFFIPAEPIDSFSAIGISSEPASGSEAPTTTPIAIGEL